MFTPTHLDTLAAHLSSLHDADADQEVAEAALALRYFAAKARMASTSRQLTDDLERLMDEYGPAGVAKAAADIVTTLAVEGRPVAPQMPPPADPLGSWATATGAQ